ncbi:MAG: hypothetical protein ACW98I_17600 [Candidatus Hodarchaeales archaeon]
MNAISTSSFQYYGLPQHDIQHNSNIEPLRGKIMDSSMIRALNGDYALNLPMNEGSGNQVFDNSGNGYNGAITGSTWQSEGLFFDGSRDYVTVGGVGATPISDPTGYDISWEFTFKCVNPNFRSYIISSGSQTDSTGFFAAVNSSNKLWVGYKTTSSRVNSGYTIDITNDVWYTVVATFTGSHSNYTDQIMQIYLNNDLVGTYNAEAVDVSNVYPDLILGHPNNDLVDNNYSWRGYLKGIKVQYSRNLPPNITPFGKIDIIVLSLFISTIIVQFSKKKNGKKCN